MCFYASLMRSASSIDWRRKREGPGEKCLTASQSGVGQLKSDMAKN